MKNKQPRSQFILLDGGMGRELMRMGAPFRQPEWSALSLMQSSHLVKKAHESFARAGSEILTTSNYAVVPFHLGNERFLRDGHSLTALAGELTQEVASEFGCRVAGSLPPLFGSYRPDLFLPEQATPLLQLIVEALYPHVDLWLAETVSSMTEARAVAKAITGDNRPFWVSYSLQDDGDSESEPPRLRSGEMLIDVIPQTLDLGASAILFNCSQPEVMAPAVKATEQELNRLEADLPIGVYANAFQALGKKPLANSTISNIRPELAPPAYLDFVDQWCDIGATIIGGCCGIGPEHISALHKWRQGG